MKKAIKLAISVAICLFAGFLGSLFNSSVKTWYAGLSKPFFNPPDWVFAPVWTALFVLMGISLYLVWVNKKTSIKAFYLFAVQLVLNILWSFFFFYMQNTLLAFMDIIALWLFIFLTMVEFRKFSKTAFWLLLPYLLWVSFAAALNLSIMILNWQ